MSLLTMVQRATRRLGISVPTSIVGNADVQVVQLLEIAQEEGEELASRFGWSKMLLTNTFTQVAAADQGLINSAVVTAGDFDYLINDSMWNRTTQEPIVGPVSGNDWETLAATAVTGVFQQFMIQSGHLYFSPVGANATDTIAFHYKSTFWCESSGGTGQKLWAADTDVGRLDEGLMRQGIIWRWKHVKGLDYAQDFEKYERSVLDAQARDGSARKLSLDSTSGQRVPGVFVPQGSWNL